MEIGERILVVDDNNSLLFVQQLLRKRKGEIKNEKAISIAIGSDRIDGSHYGVCDRRLHNDGKWQNDDDER